MCEAPCYEGLVQFYGAFYTPDSGQISIALEYMDGGSLADIIRIRKSIPEPILSAMVQKLLLVSCFFSFSSLYNYNHNRCLTVNCFVYSDSAIHIYFSLYLLRDSITCMEYNT